MWERKGAKSAQLKCSTMLHVKSADVPRPNQPGKLERVVVIKRHKNVAGTWLSVLNHFPFSDPASLDQIGHWKPDPPAFLGTNSWRRRVTHTVGRFAALPRSSGISFLCFKKRRHSAVECPLAMYKF